MIEEWKRLPHNYGNYEVSNYGRVRHVETKNVRKQFLDKRGYCVMSLNLPKKRKLNVKVHRLFALMFLENSNNYPEVNHIDCNKTNNHVSNLEWCTSSQNHMHAVKNGLYDKEKMSKIIKNKCGTNVAQYSLDGEYIKSFDSIVDAAKTVGVNPSRISDTCRGRQYKAGGYLWKYI